MESWNSKMNILLKKMSPGIVQVIRILQEEWSSIESAIQKHQANSGIQANQRFQNMQMQYLALVEVPFPPGNILSYFQGNNKI